MPKRVKFKKLKAVAVKTSSLKGGVKKMESKSTGTMASIRTIAQKAIQSKGLTEADIRKSLGIKRYEK